MANEKRLIDANALSCELDCCSFETSYDCKKVLEIITEAPTVDAVEVVHGQWIPGTGSWSTRRCSACNWKIPYGWYVDLSEHLKFCPNCGAKMDGGTK